MNAEILAPIAAGIGYFSGAMVNIWIQRRQFVPQVAELNKANAELSERLATVQGQLADERARYALRVNRAHEGACKAAKTRAAMRINLDQQRTAAQDLPEGGRA